MGANLLGNRRATIIAQEQMIVHQFYGGHDIKIIPIADVHLGARECMEDRFRQFIRMVEGTPNIYLTMGGDLINNSTRSSVGSPFTEVMPPHIQKREMANILAPVRDRILCFVPGNHEMRSRKDADDCPVYDIAAKLDLEDLYREDVAYVKVQLGLREYGKGHRPKADYRPTYTLVVAHGNGGGMLPGAAVNRGQRFGYVFSGMDLLVLGHTHVPYNIKYKKINIDSRNNTVSEESFKVVCATSWLEYAGYPVQKLLSPTAFAEQTVVLSGKGKCIEICTK